MIFLRHSATLENFGKSVNSFTTAVFMSQKLKDEAKDLEKKLVEAFAWYNKIATFNDNAKLLLKNGTQNKYSVHIKDQTGNFIYMSLQIEIAILVCRKIISGQLWDSEEHGKLKS